MCRWLDRRFISDYNFSPFFIFYFRLQFFPFFVALLLMLPTIDVTGEFSDRKSNLNPPDAISGNFSRRNICLKYIFNIQMTLFSSQFCLVVRFNPFSWKRDFFLPSWYFSIWPNSEKLMFAIVRHVDSDGKSNLSPTPRCNFLQDSKMAEHVSSKDNKYLQKNIYKRKRILSTSCAFSSARF